MVYFSDKYRSEVYMQIISLLEKLATHAHFEIDLDELLTTLPAETKEHFLTNNASSLKSMFPHSEISADRTTIFRL